MPKYLIERNLPGAISDEDLKEAVSRSQKVMQEMPDLKWLRSNLTSDRKQIVCEFESPNSALIREHAQKANLPCDRITEVTEFDKNSF